MLDTWLLVLDFVCCFTCLLYVIALLFNFIWYLGFTLFVCCLFVIVCCIVLLLHGLLGFRGSGDCVGILVDLCCGF